MLATTALLAALALAGHASSQAASENRIDHEVSALLAGIPQEGATLGERRAPVTLEVFADLEDPDSRSWFVDDLPAILRGDVRTGAIKLRFRSYKTNTYDPATFVKQQTAALAAGAQDKLWNYIEIFYHEQRHEFEPHSGFPAYVTEGYLENVARQIPGLSLTQWHTARHTGRREEQTTTEDQDARTLGLHVTPSFRIGRTGATMKNFAGHAIVKYGDQRPIALPEAQDIDKAVRELHRIR